MIDKCFELMKSNKEDSIKVLMVVIAAIAVKFIFKIFEFSNLRMFFVLQPFSIIIGVLNVLVMIAIIYAIKQMKNGDKFSFKDFGSFIRRNLIEILIIFVIDFLITVVSLLFVIPFVPTLIVKMLLSFIWQALVISNCTRFRAFVKSCNIVTNGFSKVYKYIIVNGLAIGAFLFISSNFSNYSMFEKFSIGTFWIFLEAFVYYMVAVFSLIYIEWETSISEEQVD